MASSVKLDPFGLRPRAYWPKLPEPVQGLVMNFLAYMRGEAEAAAMSSAKIAEIAREDLGAAATMQYWLHAIKTIDWLLTRSTQKQKFMEILLAQQEGRWTVPATSPATSSVPAALPVACESGEPRAKPAVAGTRSEETSGRSSRKRKSAASTP